MLLSMLTGGGGGGQGGGGGGGLGNALQSIAGAAQIATSIKQAHEAKKLQKQYVDPHYNIQQPIIDNQNLAENRASQGLSDQAMLAYNDTNDRSLTASVDAILRGGGSVNSIADLYDTSSDNASKLAMLDEEVRLKREQAYMAQNDKMAEELDKQWQLNVYNPAQDLKQTIATLKQQSYENKWKGINSIVGAVNNAQSSKLLQQPQQPGQQQQGSPAYMTDNPIAPIRTETNPYLAALQNPSRFVR